MDPRNERLVHHLLVNCATKEGTCQYFLVTPKLLTDLYYNEHVKVHTIHNAPDAIGPAELKAFYRKLIAS
jgi:structural maintenance of chromosomes protein 5